MEDDDDKNTFINHRHSIDQINMDLLLNKTKYQKYLSKTDSQKFIELVQYREKCQDYKESILQISSMLLDEPSDNAVSKEVADSFAQYSKTAIRFLEIQEANKMAQQKYEEDANDITLLHESKSNICYWNFSKGGGSGRKYRK